MRQVSQKFHDLYSKRGKFQYCIISKKGFITSEDFAEPCNWIDAFSDGSEFCIGNAFMGSFSCSLKIIEPENILSIGDIIGAYMRIVYDLDTEVDYNDENDENLSEWVLIGTYRVSEMVEDKKTKRINIQFFDMMWFLENTVFMEGFNTEQFPITYATAVEWIRNVTGVRIDNMLNTTHLINNIPLDMSCRLVLSFMLIQIGANARCKPDGMITGWNIMQSVAPPDRQFTPSKPILISEWDYDIVETEHPPISGIRISNAEGVILFSGDDSGYILETHIPWLRGQPAVDEALSFVKGYINKPVLIGNALVNPIIQPYDTVIGRVSGKEYRITYIDVRGSAMPRTDCKNGIWEQFIHPHTTSESSGGGGFGGGRNILIPHLPTPREIATYNHDDTVHVYDERFPWDGHGAPPPVYCPGTGGGGGIDNLSEAISQEGGNALRLSTEDSRFFVPEVFGIREWADILNKPSVIVNLEAIIADLQRQIDNFGQPVVLIDVTFTADVIYGNNGSISHIEIEFDRIVHGLNLTHISFMPISGNAESESLSGLGANYSLGINVISQGNVRLIISNFTEFRVTTSHVVLALIDKELVILTPAMTSNSQDGFIISAQSTLPGGWDAWRAFSRVGGVSLWASNSGFFGSPFATGDQWIRVQFPVEKSVFRYTIRSRGDIIEPSSEARDWFLEGSNDGSNWSIVDSQLDQNDAGALYSPRTYDVPTNNVQPFLNYRLRITKLNGANAWVVIGELELYGYE